MYLFIKDGSNAAQAVLELSMLQRMFESYLPCLYIPSIKITGMSHNARF